MVNRLMYGVQYCLLLEWRKQRVDDVSFIAEGGAVDRCDL